MKFLSDILAKAGLTVDGVVTLNNTATGQTPDANDNSTKLATTAWVRTFVQPYSLPIASASTLGGIKVGAGLSINPTTGVLTASSGISTRDVCIFIATAGQTTFSCSYTVDQVDVFYNGSKLGSSEFTATNGTTVVFNTACKVNDYVEIVSWVAGAGLSTSRTITIDGVTQDLTANRTWNILPTGGAAGDILAKVSGTNYDVTWIPNYTSTVQHTVKAAVAVTKGQAVYISSADGTNMIVSKASNASEGTSSKTLGLVAQDLVINGQGFVVTEGLLAGLDTSTATAGDPVWLGTNGNLIFGLLNKPTAPAHLVFIGVVTRVQQNNGEIFVKVQNGFEMSELHDYVQSGVQDNFVISYESSTSLYKPKSIATLLGYTPANAARSLTINGTSYDLTADRTWTLTTSNITEGTNLYYTDTRVGTYLTANSYATQSYVSTQINNLVSGAPGLLDTLDELAAALGDDPNFATTVSTALSNRLRIDIGTQGLTSTQQGYGRTNLGLGSLATLSSVANANITDLAYSKLTGVPSTFAPSAHTHVWTDITDRPTNLSAFTNGPGYLTGITSSQVTTALGYTPYNSTNPSGYITGITSSNVTTALGYTPYNSTNPNGYISSYTETDTLSSVTGRGATTSSALSLNGKVTFSSAVVSRPQMPGGILGLDTGDGNFDIWGISRDYYPSHATAANAWGLRWNGDNNDFEFVGGGTSRVILDMDGGNITATGTLSASGYNKTNWDTAYGWGNHASAGYITSSNIGSQTVSNASYLNALGSYVWNASNLPNSYHLGITSSFVSGSESFQSYGSVMTMRTYSGGGGSLQLYVPYSPTYGGSAVQVRFGNYDAGGNAWTSWKTLLASDNYTSYSPSLTGSGASGTWGISISGSASQLGGLTKSQLWNNSGAVHSAYQTFGAIPNFGVWFMQNSSAADTPQSASQYYVQTQGLGNEYGYGTTPGNYGLMTAVARDHPVKYTYYRTLENGTWGSWTKGAAGYADTAGSLSSMNISQFTNNSGYITSGLSTDTDSEQTVGGRIHYFNSGSGRMNMDPRWNESGYDADLGCLHLWSWTASGVPYGRAGIAFYNDSAYQYLTTKSNTTGLFLNNNAILHAGNYTSYVYSQATSNSIYSRKDTTGQWIKPYYEYSSYLTSEVPSTLTSQMGGGGLRVDFMNNNTGDGSWSHVITWSGYNRYSMSQIGTNYNTTDARLYYRQTNAHTDGWLSWKEFVFTSGNTPGIMMSGPIRRASHSSGFFEGSYNNIGGNSAYTNPIYTIGSSYNPSDSSLSNMYGIGYAHPNLWGSGKTSDWGMYVCNAGTINATIGSGSTTIWAQNDIVAYSDIRVKDNIEVIDNALEKVQNIRGVTFTRKDATPEDSHKRHAGVIAQEVLAVLPEVVSGTEQDMYSVAYGNMAGLFIEAIKELKAENDALKEILKRNNII